MEHLADKKQHAQDTLC